MFEDEKIMPLGKYEEIHKIVRTFNCEDGGAEFMIFCMNYKYLHYLAENGDTSAAKLVSIVKNFSKLLSILNKKSIK